MVVGSIVAVTGLDKTITGDTLLSGVSAMKWLEEKELPSLPTPDPVFMCSIEPYSSSQQRALDQALECLTKEDPSLRVKVRIIEFQIRQLEGSKLWDRENEKGAMRFGYHLNPDPISTAFIQYESPSIQRKYRFNQESSVIVVTQMCGTLFGLPLERQVPLS